MVGRGPHPNETVELLRSLEIPTVQGDWDEAVGMDREQTGAAWASSEAESAGDASMRWTAETMTEEHRSWLRQLPKALRVDLAGRSVAFFHGSPIREDEYLWSIALHGSSAGSRATRVMTCSASGTPMRRSTAVVGQAHFVATGSVGCGTDGDARARYAVIYIGEPDMAIGFRSVDYDHLAVVRDMAPATASRWTCCACRRPRIRTSRTCARPSPRPPAPGGAAARRCDARASPARRAVPPLRGPSSDPQRPPG